MLMYDFKFIAPRPQLPPHTTQPPVSEYTKRNIKTDNVNLKLRRPIFVEIAAAL